jgi:polyphosphate kinase
VLERAGDATVPLLERVRYLAVFASNLDEFFSVRVAGETRTPATGLLGQTAAGPPRPQVPGRVFEVAGELMLRHAACFRTAVLPALTRHGIEIRHWGELSGAERQSLHRLFRDRIYPVITPLLVDPAHPFPRISGLSLNLAVVVADPQTPGTSFARVKVPPMLPRFPEVSPHRFIALEDVIAAHLTQLFEGMQVLEHHAFRVTRGKDLDIDEQVTGTLTQALETEPPGGWKGPVVRLEAEDSISDRVLDRLTTELGIGESAVYRLSGPLDLAGLHAIADLDRPELKYPAAGDDPPSSAEPSPLPTALARLSDPAG